MNYNKKISFKIFSYIITALLSLSIVACSGENNNSDENVSTGTPVEITNPKIMNLSDYIELNAYTIFLNKEVIRTPFEGFIEKIYKNIGDEVNPGNVLFSVKTKESAAVDSLRIDIGNKVFNGIIDIRAKTKGVLTELDYHSGDFISGGEQLAIVSNPSSMRIKLNVPFEDAAKIKKRDLCIIRLPGGGKLNGYIEKSVPSVDPASQTQTFLIKLPENSGLPENLNVLVKIPIKVFKNATVVPKSAVVTDVTEDTFWLMKLINDTTAIRVNINKGIETDSLVQVISPALSKSDRIISSGAYGLPDTSKIEIVK
jgi:multidrug efflux pump subunit AcrA (membrane-fusion protein)